MADPSKLPQALEAFAKAVARHEGTRFRSAILFGSHARGDAGADSDVDVAVVLDSRPGGAFDAVRDLSAVAYDVLLDTGVLIQPVPVMSEDWEHPERHHNPQLLANIRREGRVL
jgi:predicted nucleotidyltransferase